MAKSLMIPRHFAEWPFEDIFRSLDPWSERYDNMRGINADVYETTDNVVVKMAIPGIKPEDLNLQITGDTLTAMGEVTHQVEDKDVQYLQKQLYNGRFTQMISLPTSVDVDGADAQYKDGVVTLTLPKSQDTKPKTIPIKTN